MVVLYIIIPYIIVWLGTPSLRLLCIPAVWLASQASRHNITKAVSLSVSLVHSYVYVSYLVCFVFRMVSQGMRQMHPQSNRLHSRTTFQLFPVV